MRLTQIRHEGLRAHDRDIALGRLTLLRGPIGSGKSSVSDAIRVLLLGCVPSIGRDSAAIARLMSGREIVVRATLEDGRVLERGYERSGDRITSSAAASWLPPASRVMDVVEAIRSLVGRDDREATEHLGIRALLSASAQERARRIEELLDSSSVAIGEQIARATGMAVLRLAEIDREQMPADLDALGAAASGIRLLLDAASRDAALDVEAELGRWLNGGGLAHALQRANERKRAAVASVRAQVAARAEIEDRVAALQAPAAALADVEGRRQAAVEARAAALRDLELAAQAARVRAEFEPALPAMREAVREAEAALAEARERLPRADDACAQAEALIDPEPVEAPAVVEPSAVVLAEAVRLREEAEASPEPPAARPDTRAMDRAASLTADADELSGEADAIVIPPRLSSATEAAAAEVARCACDAAEASPWREVEEVVGRLAELLEDIERAGIQEALDRLRRLATEHGGDATAAALRYRDADAALVRAEHAVAERAELIVEAERRLMELRTRAWELRAEAEELRTRAEVLAAEETTAERALWRDRVAAMRALAEEVRAGEEYEARRHNITRRADYDRAVGERAAVVADMQERRRVLMSTAAELRAAAIAAQTALDSARATLRAAEERLAGIASVTADPEVARLSAEAAAREIVALDQDLVALRGAQGLRQEMQRLVAEIDRMSAAARAWAAAEWALQQVRALDLELRARGLEARMRRYLQAAGRAEEPYIRAGKARCDFGWRRGSDGQISVEAMSGGETILFGAALAGAVVSLRGAELRILLLEGAEIGMGAEARSLCAMCEEMVSSGDIGQVVLATCLPIEAPAGWVVHDLGTPG